jgi:hypothetical protein
MAEGKAAEACVIYSNHNVLYYAKAHGTGMYDSASLLPELVEDGVRLLVYAGNTGS